MRLEFAAGHLGTGTNALEIGVIGFNSNPTDAEAQPSQVCIEVYEGKLRVHVWDGSSQDPQTTIINPLVSNQPIACEISDGLVVLPQKPGRCHIVGGQQPSVAVLDVDAANLQKRILSLLAEGSLWMHQIVSRFMNSEIGDDDVKEAVSELVSRGVVAIDDNGQLDLTQPTRI